MTTPWSGCNSILKLSGLFFNVSFFFRFGCFIQSSAHITHISQNHSFGLLPMTVMLSPVPLGGWQNALPRSPQSEGTYFLAGQATSCVYVCTLLTEPRGNTHAGLLAAAESSRLLFKISSKLNRTCLLPSATGLVLVIAVAGEEEEKARHLQ